MNEQEDERAGAVELLPCPFCGGKAFIRSGENDYGRVTIGCNARYHVCQFRPVLQMYRPDEEAIKAWNTRHMPDVAQAVGARVARIVAALNARKQTAAISEERANKNNKPHIALVYHNEIEAWDEAIAIAREEG